MNNIYSNIKTAYQAEEARKHLKGYWSKESQLTQKILILILTYFEMAKSKKSKTSQWNRFFGNQIKSGKTAKQAAEAWRKR